MKSTLQSVNFVKIIDGKQVKLYRLINKNGLEANITNYGGRVVALYIPDRHGNRTDIVLGVLSLEEYLKAIEPYFGAIIGRYGNRIAKGKFTLDGQDYKLATNNGAHHLHGGIKGYHAVVWSAKQLNNQTLELTYLSKDREEGYPGNLDIKVTYTLTDENEFKIEYTATTDKATVINLTHHSFFNLNGEGNGTINDHILRINADQYTPIDNELIPIGELENVDGSPFDFRIAKPIKQDLFTKNEQLDFGRGYDHNFVLNKDNPNENGLTLAAKVTEPISGRIMEVWTNEPGLQFYSGNFLNGSESGKTVKSYRFRNAFCLETQQYPDSPNQKNFPSTVLQPKDTYYSVCVYKFSVE